VTLPVRLLIVDDYPLVREGLKARLCSLPSLEVVGEAGDAQEAAEQIEATNPDLVLMDVGMKDVNGIDLTRCLLAERPDLLVLVLSMYDNPEYVNRAMQAGARGYLLKDAPASDIIDAIAEVTTGGTFLSSAISGRLFRSQTPRPMMSRAKAKSKYAVEHCRDIGAAPST
jgi:DNA-binding NarL/FixJ family response regulator